MSKIILSIFVFFLLSCGCTKPGLKTGKKRHIDEKNDFAAKNGSSGTYDASGNYVGEGTEGGGFDAAPVILYQVMDMIH